MDDRQGRRHLGGYEFERDAVDAVAQASRRRSILEDMSLMPITARTMDFRARHEEFEIGARLDHLRIDRLPEARPARAAVEFVFRGEQRKVTTGAMVNARLMVLMERTRESPFRIFMTQYPIGSRRQQLLPFIVALYDFHDRAYIDFCGHVFPHTGKRPL